mmetsp:Transcript_63175/g.186710  ORF Transcript_63175/g.186710 Transcript_63175/m.186710 type:complete len:408 (-) Transcript_63175:653-1876(-)
MPSYSQKRTTDDPTPLGKRALPHAPGGREAVDPMDPIPRRGRLGDGTVSLVVRAAGQHAREEDHRRIPQGVVAVHGGGGATPVASASASARLRRRKEGHEGFVPFDSQNVSEGPTHAAVSSRQLSAAIGRGCGGRRGRILLVLQKVGQRHVRQYRRHAALGGEALPAGAVPAADGRQGDVPASSAPAPFFRLRLRSSIPEGEVKVAPLLLLILPPRRGLLLLRRRRRRRKGRQEQGGGGGQEGAGAVIAAAHPQFPRGGGRRSARRAEEISGALVELLRFVVDLTECRLQLAAVAQGTASPGGFLRGRRRLGLGRQRVLILLPAPFPLAVAPFHGGPSADRAAAAAGRSGRRFRSSVLLFRRRGDLFEHFGAQRLPDLEGSTLNLGPAPPDRLHLDGPYLGPHHRRR